MGGALTGVMKSESVFVNASTFERQRSSHGVLAADKVDTFSQFVQHWSAHARHDAHTGHHVRRVCHLEANPRASSPTVTISFSPEQTNQAPGRHIWTESTPRDPY